MKRRSLADDERGAVYVEFLVAFMPIFLLFLSMIQISMLFTAKLVVKHAAYRATRSAIVILPDDPARYGGAPKDEVDFNEFATSRIVPDAIQSLASFLGVDLPDNLLSRGDSRLNMIRLSAAVPLLGLAPSPQYLRSIVGIRFGSGGDAAESVLDGIGFTGRGQDNLTGRGVAGLLYTLTAMSVTFPSAPGGAAATSGTVSPTRHAIGETSRLTGRVTYAYSCVIPGAATLLCDGFNRIRDQGDGSGRDELNGAPIRGAGLAIGCGLYYALRAEYTMTYQGAAYSYGDDGGDDET